MWKSTCSMTFLEGGVVAEVFHEYIPSAGEYKAYPPYVRRRIFVKREEAVKWISLELEMFDPKKYMEEEAKYQMLQQSFVGPVGEA